MTASLCPNLGNVLQLRLCLRLWSYLPLGPKRAYCASHDCERPRHIRDLLCFPGQGDFPFTSPREPHDLRIQSTGLALEDGPEIRPNARLPALRTDGAPRHRTTHARVSKVLFRLRQSTATFAEPEVRELRQSVELSTRTVPFESDKETSDRAMTIALLFGRSSYCGV